MNPERPTAKQRIDAGVTELQHVDFVAKHQPEYLGAGAEHVVFEIPDKPQLVVKVHKFSLEQAALRPERANEAAQQLLEDRAAYAELKRYFGAAVMREKQYIAAVPVTKELLQETSSHPEVFTDFPAGEQSLPAIVRIQERVPAQIIENGILVPFVHNRVELQPNFTRETYAKINASFLDGEGENDRAFFEQCSGPNIRQLLARMDTDQELRATVHDFITRAIQYSNETGEMLDLTGGGNVVLFQDGDAWKYLLPDARYPTRQCVTRTRATIHRLETGQPTDGQDSHEVINTLNYARIVNGLAAQLGIPERIQLSEGKVAAVSAELFNIAIQGREEVKQGMKRLFVDVLDFVRHQAPDQTVRERLLTHHVIANAPNDPRVEIMATILEHAFAEDPTPSDESILERLMEAIQ